MHPRHAAMMSNRDDFAKDITVMSINVKKPSVD